MSTSPDAELFTDYLTTLQTVLNGEAFLFHFTSPSGIDNGLRTFDELVARDIIGALLRDYYDLPTASGPDEQLYLYRTEPLPFDASSLDQPPANQAATTELTREQFRNVLLSTLDCERRAFGHFSSFYNTALSKPDAAKQVDRLQLQGFDQCSADWRYYWVDVDSFQLDMKQHHAFCWRLFNDSCILTHDPAGQLMVLLTNGTD